MKLAAKLNGRQTIRTPHYDPDGGTAVDAGDIPLSRGAIWLMANSISHVARPEEEGEWQYFSSSKKIGWKTGTSYGNRDAWAVGMTPDYAVGVWVGNCTGEGRPLMTGVGYAAPVLFEVFGLLPKGEWFAEPLGDLEPAVVCRQSGYLASHICPDRDTVMIPRAAALGEVCPYHRIVNLSADLKYRVTADCYDPARIVRMPMFILPLRRSGITAGSIPTTDRCPRCIPACRVTKPKTTPSTSSIRSRGVCWSPRGRSKGSSRALSLRPCTATAMPCCSGISTTTTSVRPLSNTKSPSVRRRGSTA